MYLKFTEAEIATEVWKETHIDKNYEVSSLGRVRSKDRIIEAQRKYRKQVYFRKGKIISIGTNWGGNQKVRLGTKKIPKIASVSRIVAVAFVKNPNNLPCACHIKEEIPQNNRADNFFWGTYSDNMKDMYRKGRGNDFRGTKSPNHKKAYQYDLAGNLIKIWDYFKQVKELGFQETQVSACCRGKVLSHRGFVWSFTELPKAHFENISIGQQRNNKKVFQYRINGDIVKVYESIKSAIEDGFTGSNITACCQGKAKSHANFIWSYAELDFSKFKQARWNTRQKKIHQLTLDGKLVKEYRSATSAQKEGFYFPYVKDCLDNKRTQYKGFRWVAV
jgi:hypothetical protein